MSVRSRTNNRQSVTAKATASAKASPQLLAKRQKLLESLQTSTHWLDACFTVPIPFPISLAVSPFRHFFNNFIVFMGLVGRSVIRSSSRQRQQYSSSAVSGESSAARRRREFKGTEVTVGARTLIGLIPVLGDVASFALSMYPVYLVYQMDPPASLLLWMVVTRLIDLVVGAIPILGDMLSAAFKINLWSYRIVKRWVEKEADKAGQPEGDQSSPPAAKKVKLTSTAHQPSLAMSASPTSSDSESADNRKPANGGSTAGVSRRHKDYRDV
ncbi:hypothetical protein H4R34_002499 [Dimargaris verticillata]|uniref:Uncharacterized protein n=1 Tax=Dimargaris verticillata TaxID=2761393 RepID=A0A9W8B2G5_9FUNG|nr:hypothetical protein H4R34_002499 [Dimargaris verticillata]